MTEGMAQKWKPVAGKDLGTGSFTAFCQEVAQSVSCVVVLLCDARCTEQSIRRMGSASSAIVSGGTRKIDDSSFGDFWAVVFK